MSEDSNTLFSNYAARIRIYPRSVTGRYARLRWAAVGFTQLLFYVGPWLQWNGRQAILFDLGARQFYLFGLVLWPQDFVYLAALLVIAALTLFLVTAVAGRLWCGYSCPQTVYTEIFMWVEQRVEGDRTRRKKLDAAPWSIRKLRIKAAKHLIWIIIALWTGLTFIGYFAPMRDLVGNAARLSLGPWQWFWWLFYSAATWGNAGFLREQVCQYMCPYARFQGAMFDKDTLIVTYDSQRGEPRGSRSRQADTRALGLGSCIDCNLCVHVCPTGIDIRDGQQYECIGCAACIDVCNTVMDRMNYPRGLVRYATDHALAWNLSPEQALRRVMRPRVLLYAGVLLALIIALIASLALRNPLKVDVMRDRNAIARISEGGGLENTYRLQFMNASESSLLLEVSVGGIAGASILGPDRFEVAATANRIVAVSVRIPADSGHTGSNPIEFLVEQLPASAADAGRLMRRTEKAVFMVPRP